MFPKGLADVVSKIRNQPSDGRGHNLVPETEQISEVVDGRRRTRAAFPLVSGLFAASSMILKTTWRTTGLLKFVARTALELAALGPLGPFMSREAVNVLRNGTRLVKFVLTLHGGEITLWKALSSGVVGEIKGIKLRRKLLLLFIIAQHANGKRRLHERVMRAAGVQAFRRLDRAGLNKLLLAVNQNPKLQALLPKVITDDQQWVELAESWLRFSPDERVRWLNNLISVMWPHLNTIIYKVMDETVEPLIEEAMKDMKGISGISFQDFSLGNVPLGIETIQVAQNHGDLVIDVALRWNAAVNIVADVTLSPSAITMNQKMALLSVTLNRLQVVGKMRIILKEVMPTLPVVGGITITLMEEPYIDFSVSIGEKSVGGLPGFKALINTLMKKAVKEHILFPMCVPIPVANPGFTATGERRDRSLFIEKLRIQPLGTLRVHILEARGLPVSDFLVRSSDPYVTAAIGLGRTFFAEPNKLPNKTQVIPSSLNPVWKNESFTLDVHSLVSQYLLLWIFDHDSSKYDDEMCYVQLSLGAMQTGVSEDKWWSLHLASGMKVGRNASPQIRLRMEWRPKVSNNLEVGLTGEEIRLALNQETAQLAHRMSVSRASSLLSRETIPKEIPEEINEELRSRSSLTRKLSHSRSGVMRLVQFQCVNINRLRDKLHGRVKSITSRRDQNKPTPARRFREDLARTLHIPVGPLELYDFVVNTHGTLENFSPRELRAISAGAPEISLCNDGLAPWMVFPFIDKALWLDTLLLSLWPYLKPVVHDLMNKVNEKVLYGLILPHELKAFVNLKATVDLGELPPLIDGFRVMPSENKRDGCLLEVILKLAGDQVIRADAGFLSNPLSQVSVEVSQLQVFCSLRIRLRPLVPMVPIIAGVSISFMGPPTLDAAIAVSLSPLLPPLNLCNIPGFRTLKDVFIKRVLMGLMGYPKGIHIPIMDFSNPVVKNLASVVTGNVAEMNASRYLLNVNVTSATNVPIGDVFTSDPYAVVVVCGPEAMQERTKRTATKKNTLNPVWDEDPMSFETATKDVDVLIAVFDSDFGCHKAGSLFSKKKDVKTVVLSSTILAQLNNFEEIVTQSRKRHDEFHLDVVQVPLSKAVSAACDFINRNEALKVVAKTLTDAYMEDARLGLNRIPWEQDSQEAEDKEAETSPVLTTRASKKLAHSHTRSPQAEAKRAGRAAHKSKVETKRNKLCDAERVVYEHMQVGNELLGLYYFTASELERLLPPPQDQRVPLPNEAEVTRELQCNPVLKRKNTSAPAEFKVQFRWHRLGAARPVKPTTSKQRTESKESMAETHIDSNDGESVRSLELSPAEARGGMEWGGQAEVNTDLGVLTVEVERVSDLYGRDKDLKPFVTIAVGATVMKTAVYKGKNPQMDERKTFYNVDPSTMIRIRVVNTNYRPPLIGCAVSTKRDFGEVLINIQQVKAERSIMQKWPLQNSRQGSISMKLSWLDALTSPTSPSRKGWD